MNHSDKKFKTIINTTTLWNYVCTVHRQHTDTYLKLQKDKDEDTTDDKDEKKFS